MPTEHLLRQELNICVAHETHVAVADVGTKCLMFLCFRDGFACIFIHSVFICGVFIHGVFMHSAPALFGGCLCFPRQHDRQHSFARGVA